MLSKRTLPLSALRAFESAGTRLHMGKAGEDLGVTHGAISHQIRSLEKDLGVKLFTRDNNSLQLTDAGCRLLLAVSDGFNRILDGTLHLDPDNLSGELHVGCTQTAGANWLAKTISEFQKTYPLIEIHTVEIKPQQKVIPREIDVAICYGKPDEKQRQVKELASLDIFPVCSPAMLHKQKKVSRHEHLANFPLLHEGLNNWDRWFSSNGIVIPEHTQNTYFYNTNLTLSAAREGYGVALCNRLETQYDLVNGRLIKLLNSSIPERDSYYLLTNKPEQQSLRAQLFEERITDIFS